MGALAVGMLVTPGCSNPGAPPEEAVAEFLGTMAPEEEDAAGGPTPPSVAEELLGVRFVCDLLGNPDRTGGLDGLSLGAFGHVITLLLDDPGHAHLERRVDFGAEPERLGPSCLWQQPLDEIVTNQLSIVVTPLRVGDVVRGQGGEPVEVDSGVALVLGPSGGIETVEVASGRPALEVSFDPTDDPPMSIPGDDGLRVWHRGEVNLWWRREAGPMGPLVYDGRYHEPRAVPFPGMWIKVGVTGEITMYPDEELRLRLMAVAAMTEQAIVHAHLEAVGPGVSPEHTGAE